MNTETEQYTYQKTVEGLNPGVSSRLHMIDQVNVVLNRTVVSLPRRRFWGGSYFFPPHKRLLN